MAQMTKGEKLLVTEALLVYGGEVGKIMKKAEKLNLPETEKLKQKYLEVAALRDRIANDD